MSIDRKMNEKSKSYCQKFLDQSFQRFHLSDAYIRLQKGQINNTRVVNEKNAYGLTNDDIFQKNAYPLTSIINQDYQFNIDNFNGGKFLVFLFCQCVFIRSMEL